MSLLFVSITDSVCQRIIRHGYESFKPLTPLSCCELLLQGHVIEHRVATVRWRWNFCLLGVPPTHLAVIPLDAAYIAKQCDSKLC